MAITTQFLCSKKTTGIPKNKVKQKLNFIENIWENKLNFCFETHFSIKLHSFVEYGHKISLNFHFDYTLPSTKSYFFNLAQTELLSSSLINFLFWANNQQYFKNWHWLSSWLNLSQWKIIHEQLIYAFAILVSISERFCESSFMQS